MPGAEQSPGFAYVGPTPASITWAQIRSAPTDVQNAGVMLRQAPKSDASYRALGRVMETIESHRAEPVPFHLRNAVTGSMKQWGYGAGYQHAHKFEDALPDMECLPESLAGTIFYEPTDRGAERDLEERLRQIRNRKKTKQQPPQ